MQVTEELHPLVRTDSVASIETEGLVGGSFLSISAGSGRGHGGGTTLHIGQPGAVRDWAICCSR